MTEEGRDEIAEPVPNVVRNPAPPNDRKEGFAMKERERGSNCKNRAKQREMIRFANEITREEENIDC